MEIKAQDQPSVLNPSETHGKASEAQEAYLKRPSSSAVRHAELLLEALEQDAPSNTKLLKALGRFGIAAAASLGKPQELRAILNASRVGDRRTALHHLVEDDAPLLALKTAVRLGADIHATSLRIDESGVEHSKWTVLHEATRLERPGAVAFLFQQKADPHARDSTGATALRALYGDGSRVVNQQIVDLHLAAKTDINSLDKAGSNALSATLCAKNYGAIPALMNRGATLAAVSTEELQGVINSLANDAYHSASRHDWSQLVLVLDVLEKLRPVLGRETVFEIVNVRAEKDSKTQTIAHYIAAAGGPADAVRRLSDLGADMNACADFTYGKKDARSDVTPLHLVAYHKHNELVNEFCETGGNPKLKDSRGETALFMLYRNRATSTDTTLVDTIVGAGADVNELNNAGDNCPTICARSGWWDHVTHLGRYGGRPRGLTDANLKEMSESFSRLVVTMATMKQWDRLHQFFAAAENSASFLPPHFFATALNAPAPGRHELSPFQKICVLESSPATVVRQALQLGADPNSEFTFAVRNDFFITNNPQTGAPIVRFVGTHAVNFGETVEIQKVSPLHVMVHRGRQDLCETLCDFKADVHHRDALGNVPHMYAYQFRAGQIDPQALLPLFQAGAVPYARNHAGDDFFLGALNRGDTAAIAALGDFLIRPPAIANRAARWYHIDAPDNHELFKDTLVKVVEAAKQIRLPDMRAGMLSMLQQTERVDLALLYAQAYDEAVHRQDRSDGLSFTKLLPHFLVNMPQGSAGAIARGIEYNSPATGLFVESEAPTVFGKGKFYRSHAHPNEAELMALLHHPEDPQLRDPAVGVLTASITSIYRLVYFSMNVTNSTAYNWGRIGNLSFSFSRWRYDAARVVGTNEEQVLPSLLELYGLKPTPPLVTDNVHGKGFILEPGSKNFSYLKDHKANGSARTFAQFNSKISMIMRRGHMVVSHPTMGTLVIRNSSPEFGRDTMRHPAYWSYGGIGGAFSADQLLYLDDEFLAKHFEHILSPELNGSARVDDLQKRLGFLLEQADALFTDYGAWKLDSRRETAFIDLGEGGLVHQGFNASPGFEHLVRFLNAAYEESLRHPEKKNLVPDLAFISPSYNPWLTFAFNAIGGHEAHRLKVTPDILEVLNKIVDGEVTGTDMKRTGLQFFFQEAGFDKEGELALLKPV